MGNHWTMSEKGREKISRFAKERYKDSSVLTECKNCNKQIKVPKSRYENGKGKYCSKECQYTDKKGVRNSIDTEFKEGNKPWNYQKCGYRLKLSKQQRDARSKRMIGNKHKPTMDNVTYSGIHSWIIRNYGKAFQCVDCGINNAKQYCWHNKDGKYTRDINDWEQLCQSCHVRKHNLLNIRNKYNE